MIFKLLVIHAERNLASRPSSSANEYVHIEPNVNSPPPSTKSQTECVTPVLSPLTRLSRYHRPLNSKTNPKLLDTPSNNNGR